MRLHEGADSTGATLGREELVIAAGILIALAAAGANAAVVLQAAEDRQAPLSQSGRFSLGGESGRPAPSLAEDA